MKIILNSADTARAISLKDQENPKLSDFGIPQELFLRAEEITYESPLGRRIVLKSRSVDPNFDHIKELEIIECRRILAGMKQNHASQGKKPK